MKKIKIAQIGTSHNSHGSSIFNSLKKQSDLFEIVGYALPENEREKFPEEMKQNLPDQIRADGSRQGTAHAHGKARRHRPCCF